MKEEEVPSLEQLITFQENDFGKDISPNANVSVSQTNDDDVIIEDVLPDPVNTITSTPEPTKVDDPELDPIDDPEVIIDNTLTPDPDKTTSDDHNIYQAYYDHLKETGFLALGDDFEFDGTPEKLEEAFALSDKNKWDFLKQSLVDRIPEEGKPLIEYFLAGGKDIKKYLDISGNVDLGSLDINNTRDQRKILYEYYKRTSNYPDDKIERMIDKLESLDSLQDDAVEAVEELRNLEKSQKEKLIRETEQEEINKHIRLREEIQSINQAIEKSDFIEDKRKTKVKAFLFNQRTSGNETFTDYNRTLSNISANPEHLAQLADILLDYDSTKGFVMDRFKNKGKTEANKNFRDTLDSKLDPKSKIKGKDTMLSKEKINWEDLLTQMDRGR